MKYLNQTNLNRLRATSLEITAQVDKVSTYLDEGPNMLDDALFGVQVKLEMMSTQVRALRAQIRVKQTNPEAPR